MKNKFGAGSTEGAERERNCVTVQSEGRKSTLVWIPAALLFFTFDFFPVFNLWTQSTGELKLGNLFQS